jgi:beta-xylosidase
MGWYNLRTPIKPFHTFDTRQGCLTLTSNGMHIEQLECPAMLLRKQTAYIGKWSTKLHFEPESEYDQAGTTVYYSAFSFAAIYITKENGRLAIVARWTDHETRTIQVGLARKFWGIY